MRKLLRKILKRPILYLANKFSSNPDGERVRSSLSNLYSSILESPGKKGLILEFADEDKYIVFSDQHKGIKNGSDDYAFAEKNYLTALDYYYQNNFKYISLGDSEEFWENSVNGVIKTNKASFEKERLFAEQKRFYKVFGNHDLYWDNDPLAKITLEHLYGKALKTYEAIIMRHTVEGKAFDIFLTHGHQGDLQSDGNWFSKWFIANVWAPLQIYLGVNLNTPAYDTHLKTEHNRLMYEWVSKRKNTLLITGHTHQPVFSSLTLFEKLYRDLNLARLENDERKVERLQTQINLRKSRGETSLYFTAYRPTYCNTGCCCYNDGDITGIEIEQNCIRLVKWEYNATDFSNRLILDEAEFSQLFGGSSNI